MVAGALAVAGGVGGGTITAPTGIGAVAGAGAAAAGVAAIGHGTAVGMIGGQNLFADLGNVGSNPGSSSLNNYEISNKIGNGHAYSKHVVRKAEFEGISSREQFSSHIENVLNNPTEVRNLKNGRTGYWDEGSSTVVIHDPGRVDQGTAFVSDYQTFMKLK